jgi:pyroglutamyl-peptidase
MPVVGMRDNDMKIHMRQTACVLALLIAASCAAGEKPVLLLTGFEPFGGLKLNASWETVKTFQGKEIAGHRIETALLPVVYDEMAAPLQEAIAKHKPAAVISFGVGTQVIQIETVARNGYHRMKPPDNKNKPPPRSEIVPGESAEIPTALPSTEILAALKAANIGAASSTDAGGYLCNECFYRLMSVKDGPAIRGFVHVPDFGTRDIAGGIFDQQKLIRALEVVIETTLKKTAVK